MRQPAELFHIFVKHQFVKLLKKTSTHTTATLANED
jgi:hypothetical protein